MYRTMVKSEISSIRVTQCFLDDMGCITIDQDLLDAADVLPGEVVSVLWMLTGTRSDAHVVAGKRGSGTVAIQVAGGQRVEPGDRLVVISYALVTEAEAKTFLPRQVAGDRANRLADRAHQPSPDKLGSI